MWLIKTRKFFHMTSRKQTDQGECFMKERQPNSPEHKDRSGWQRIGEDIRAGYYSFTRNAPDVVPEPCLLCDDRRSRSWASRDGPRRDRSRSDIGMISMNFNSYSSLVIFFHHSCFVLFCFWSGNFTYYTSVSCVWFLLPYISLPSN